MAAGRGKGKNPRGGRGGAKKSVNRLILSCDCLPNFNGLKSTLPRCAPQVLVFAGRGKESFLLGGVELGVGDAS